MSFQTKFDDGYLTVSTFVLIGTLVLSALLCIGMTPPCVPDSDLFEWLAGAAIDDHPACLNNELAITSHSNEHGTTVEFWSALKKGFHDETLKGIPLEKHKYPEQGRHIMVAWQVLRHDEKSNRNWTKSTIENFITVVEDAKLRVPGYYIS